MKLLPEPDQKPVLLTPKENPLLEALGGYRPIDAPKWNQDQLYQLSRNAQQSMSFPPRTQT